MDGWPDKKGGSQEGLYFLELASSKNPLNYCLFYAKNYN